MIDRVLAAAALRRDDHRPLARLLAAVGDGRRRDLHDHRGRSTRWSCPAGRVRSPSWSALAVGDRRRLRPPVPGRGPPVRRARRGRPRRSRSCSTRSASSPRTRSFPVTLPAGQDRAPRRRRAARRGDPRRRSRISSASRWSTSSRWASPAPGGSTPLRLRVAGDPDTYLFGKLYAMNHVRADRWYKLGRTILYGRLEDEAPFQSCAASSSTRTTRSGSCATPACRRRSRCGIVELTPEREYLLVTEFLDGAEEIGDAEVDDRSSTRACRSSASSGTPGSPTATSSRPT